MLQDVLDTNEDTTLVGELQLKKLLPESNFGSATEQEAKLKTNEDVILSVVLEFMSSLALRIERGRCIWSWTSLE